jgi:hypothetical protein
MNEAEKAKEAAEILKETLCYIIDQYHRVLQLERK